MAAESPAHSPATGRAVACPDFHAAIELIGRRWNGVVLQQLLDGPLRYSELRNGIDGVTDAMLSQRLKDLETAGLISREVTPARPIEVRYALTDIGARLSPVLSAVGHWARDWAHERRSSLGSTDASSARKDSRLG